MSQFNQPSSIAASIIPMINQRLQADLAEKYKTEETRTMENVVSAELNSMLQPHIDRVTAILNNPDSSALEKAIANKLYRRWSGLSPTELAAIPE